MKRLDTRYKAYPLVEEKIDKDALSVIKTLTKNRFQAYLVGGCVRDLLLERQPKDFDVVTNATPNEIKKIFRRARLVGRRFRLAHILFDGYKYIEVATFRGQSQHQTKTAAEGQIVRDNTYGSIEQDVVRRDLTINALYYDVLGERIIDFVGGLSDISNKKLNIIGDPETRYREDPVRMLRVIRFCAKLKFEISDEQGQQIYELSHLISNISPARLFEEVLKLFHNEKAREILDSLIAYGLWPRLFQQTHPNLFIEKALENTEARFVDNLPLAPAFIFAVFLWQPFLSAFANHTKKYKNKGYAHDQAVAEVINKQMQQVMMPKWVATQLSDIWSMQYQLEDKHPKKTEKLLANRRFRAAYDFLLLRSLSTNPELAQTVAFWQKKQT